MLTKSWKGSEVRTSLIVALLAILIGGLLSMLIQGCTQRTVKVAFDSAVVSKEAYTATLSTLGELYKEGVVDEGTKDLAIEYGRVYKEAHNAMVIALADYAEDQANLTARKAYLNAAINASHALAKLLTLVEPYLVREGAK